MTNTINKLQELAVNEALANNWNKAITVNFAILKIERSNVDALLRLGFAQLQMGNLPLAKKAYLKALKIMPANQIAKNNLANIKILEKRVGASSKVKHINTITLNPNLFLNIPGKTKVITLINIGQAGVLANLKIGQKTVLKVKKRHVEVRTENGEYIGAVPDDLSKRLIYFMDAKSIYTTYIKEAARNSVDIFIREEKLGRKVKKYISFPKNIQDNLKMMNDSVDTKVDDLESDSEEEISLPDRPIDLEELAQEFDDTEVYPEERASDEEDDDE